MGALKHRRFLNKNIFPRSLECFIRKNVCFQSAQTALGWKKI